MTNESADDIATKLGRRAARLLRAAQPAARRLAQQAGPGVQKAGRAAADYASTHQDELKLVARKALLGRVRGPIGVVVDALSRPPSSGGGDSTRQTGLRCPACESVNAMTARFCDQCGSQLWEKG